MNKPLFILQPVCRERTLCRECRSTETSMYRDGWAQRYKMPREWPKCPFGISMGFEGNGKLVAPDVQEVDQAYLDRMEEKAAKNREVCLDCPSKRFMGITEDGLTVDCKIGHGCCSGYSRGMVNLATGICNGGHWSGVQITRY